VTARLNKNTTWHGQVAHAAAVRTDPAGAAVKTIDGVLPELLPVVFAPESVQARGQVIDRAAPARPGSRSIRAAPVLVTIGRALVALAPETDPETWRVPTSPAMAAAGVDPQLLIEGSRWYLVYLIRFRSEILDELRQVGIDEYRRRLLVALIVRVQPGGIWQLINLPDTAGGKAKPFHNDQLADLTPDSFDIERVRFGDPERS
jgi:hypothetical protein